MDQGHKCEMATPDSEIMLKNLDKLQRNGKMLNLWIGT